MATFCYALLRRSPTVAVQVDQYGMLDRAGCNHECRLCRYVHRSVLCRGTQHRFDLKLKGKEGGMALHQLEAAATLGLCAVSSPAYRAGL
jgi:hypothetical protein